MLHRNWRLVVCFFLVATLSLKSAHGLEKDQDGGQPPEGENSASPRKSFRADSSSSSSSSSGRRGSKGNRREEQALSRRSAQERILKEEEDPDERNGKGKGGKKRKKKKRVDNMAAAAAAETFVNATFQSGVVDDGNYTLDLGNRSLDIYDVSFNYTVGDWGFVSLAAAPELIDGVSCNSDGSVMMELSSEIDPETPLENLFPTGSVLVVSADSFGPCRLQGGGGSNQTFPELEDGYLVIEEVSGTPQDVTIRGTVTSFFSLFRLANISIVRRPTENDDDFFRENRTVDDTTPSRRRRLSAPSNTPSIMPSPPSMNEPSGSSPATDPSLFTSSPTVDPSSNPTRSPTRRPTGRPTDRPSDRPSDSPSRSPSDSPSSSPSSSPSTSPSVAPSTSPSTSPSSSPSVAPSTSPSSSPSSPPSEMPTSPPTELPDGRLNVEVTFDLVRLLKLAGRIDPSTLEFLGAELKFTASVLARIDEINIDIGADGVNIFVTQSVEYSYDAIFELFLKNSGGLSVDNDLLLTLPIGPLGRAISIPIRGVPAIKAGLLFEVGWSADFSIMTQAKIGMNAKLNFVSGRKQHRHYIRGPWLGIESGTDVLKDEKQSQGLTTDIRDENAVALEGDAQFFISLNPQVSFSGTVASISVGIPVGVEARGLFRIPAWPPVGASGGDRMVTRPLLGACDECHWARFVPSIRADVFKITGTLGVDIDAGPFTISSVSVDVFSGVQVRTELLTYCFEDKSVTQCGMEKPVCCNVEMGEMCVPTEEGDGEEVCNMAPTQSPVTMPEPLPPFNPPPGRSGSSNGDPHIYTFDGVGYDCQASGEFIFARSLDSPFVVQVRHSGLGRSFSQISVNTGVAIMEKEDSPLVQFSFAKDFGPDAYDLGGCPLLTFVDGQAARLENRMDVGGNVTVLVGTGRDIRVTFESTGIVVGIRGWSTAGSIFGCALNVRLFLPDTFLADNRVVGLLGTPNQVSDDDWSTDTGETIPIPSNRIGQVAYVYCTQNWCVRNETDSLFTYENGTGFENITGCDIPFRGGVDLTAVPPELVELCGVDPACLIDGLVGDLQAAQEILMEQVEDDRVRAAASPFKFNPSTIAVNQAVVVDVTLDVSGADQSATDKVERFALYRVNVETGVAEPTTPVGTLVDNGAMTDVQAGDLLFSGVVNLLSTVGGQVFGFRAIPIVNGTEDSTSTLVTTTISAVRSFTALSGAVGNSTSAGGLTLTVAVLDERVQLAVKALMPPLDEDDLLLAVNLFNETFGSDCGTSTSGYLSIAEEKANKKKKKKKKKNANSKDIAVLVGEAFENGAFDEGPVVMGVFADVAVSRGSGKPLELELSVEDNSNNKKKKKKKKTENQNPDSLVVVVQPGSMKDPNDVECPLTKVADVFIITKPDGSADIQLLVTSPVVE